MDGSRFPSRQRRVESTSELLALVQGIAVVKIEREGLWHQGGYHSLQEYRIAQNERLGMPRQTLSHRRKMAEGYLDNRKLLARVPLAGNLLKLELLSEALTVYEDRREVLQHFKADSYREFLEWVRPRITAPDLPDVSLSIDDGEIALDGVPLLAFDEDLAVDERTFISQGLRDLYRARRGGCLAHVVPVYDAGEARAVDNFIRKRRASK